MLEPLQSSVAGAVTSSWKTNSGKTNSGKTKKNPQIFQKKFSNFSTLNMLQAAKYYNDQNNQQIY